MCPLFEYIYNPTWLIRRPNIAYQMLLFLADGNIFGGIHIEGAFATVKPKYVPQLHINIVFQDFQKPKKAQSQILIQFLQRK